MLVFLLMCCAEPPLEKGLLTKVAAAEGTIPDHETGLKEIHRKA